MSGIELTRRRALTATAAVAACVALFALARRKHLIALGCPSPDEIYEAACGHGPRVDSEGCPSIDIMCAIEPLPEDAGTKIEAGADASLETIRDGVLSFGLERDQRRFRQTCQDRPRVSKRAADGGLSFVQTELSSRGGYAVDGVWRERSMGCDVVACTPAPSVLEAWLFEVHAVKDGYETSPLEGALRVEFLVFEDAACTVRSTITVDIDVPVTAARDAAARRPCVPGSVRCEHGEPQKCSRDGIWFHGECRRGAICSDGVCKQEAMVDGGA